MRPVHSFKEPSSSSMVPMRVFEACCCIVAALTSSLRLVHHRTDEHTDDCGSDCTLPKKRCDTTATLLTWPGVQHLHALIHKLLMLMISTLVHLGSHAVHTVSQPRHMILTRHAFHGGVEWIVLSVFCVSQYVSAPIPSVCFCSSFPVCVCVPFPVCVLFF